MKTYVEIKKAFAETRNELAPLLKRLDLEKISKHNNGYLEYTHDRVTRFIDAEERAHIKIIENLIHLLPEKACIVDIGFFIPIIPVTLSKLGFRVISFEKLSFYGDALDELITWASSAYEIEVMDFDILNDEILIFRDRFDAVILSAILEHLNGSPRLLLERASIIGKKNAYYFFTVPNVASLQKRVSLFFKGVGPFPPICVYYNSAYPFTGHNREYSMNDLAYVLKKSGYNILKIEAFNCHIPSVHSIKDQLNRIIAKIGSESLRDSIIAIAKKI